MIIRCQSRYLTQEQADALGRYFHANSDDWALIPGQDYVVFGLSFHQAGGLVNILAHSRFSVNGVGIISTAPMCLFDVVDGHVSRFWEARVLEDGILRLWPSVFYQDDFNSRLARGEEEIVAQFREIRRTIEDEAQRNYADPSRH